MDFMFYKGLSLKELEESMDGLSSRMKFLPRQRFHAELNKWLSEG